jgi:phenylacetic acid degradation operon negative regulatory protein
MKEETEELLYTLLWAWEFISRPSFRMVGESFEGWAYRKGLLRRIERLRAQKLIEFEPWRGEERVVRLTQAGRLAALGGRDPEVQWNRSWDGIWRVIVFDIPTTNNHDRNRLRKLLRQHHFGYLQDSVWITPDPVQDTVRDLLKLQGAADSLLFLDAKPASGESQHDIVRAAWNLPHLNEGYRDYLQVLRRRPRSQYPAQAATEGMLRWLQSERRAWCEAVNSDPLLPQPLLPRDYQGQRAWQKRRQALLEAGGQVGASPDDPCPELPLCDAATPAHQRIFPGKYSATSSR